MSRLCQELDRYLTIRRSLGYDLGTTARVLRRFIAFADSRRRRARQHRPFPALAGELRRRGPPDLGGALGMVRLFAQWLHGLDPAHEAPPRGLIPHRIRRSRPYIYSEAEIASIVAAAAELPSLYGLRGLTYSTLFGLIAVTGLRISEALALDAGDVDLDDRRAHLRRGKFGKARLVPLADSVIGAPARLRQRTRPAARLCAAALLCQRARRPRRRLRRPLQLRDRLPAIGLRRRSTTAGMAAARASMICAIASPPAR